MIIKLMPQRRDDTLSVVKSGDVLTLNGEAFDFSAISDGASLPAAAVSSEWVIGDVSRTDGELTVTLILPHGYPYSQEQAFPADIVDPADGEIALPQAPATEEVANG
ncbi:hypothetical protein [Pseudomonas typographi]|uniref:hypothetical protein n=1 Tax=Pseudomonas typographi TaxID=2715964 RepID=UPI001687223A|nr:hypothetical protein [Pseudomonas typographi]MBD1590266.1 hypothetical protein [Pseudomonas typographi]